MSQTRLTQDSASLRFSPRVTRAAMALLVVREGFDGH